MEIQMENRPLRKEEIMASLQDYDDLKSWRFNSEDKLERLFTFTSFPEAFSFMTRVAFECEKIGHHPDWENSFNTVTVRLSTHDAGGVTDKDIELARRIERINWM